MFLNTPVYAELQLLAFLSLPELNESEVKKSFILIKNVDFKQLQSLVKQHRTWSCVYRNINKYFQKNVPVNFYQYVENKHSLHLKNCQKQFFINTQLDNLFKKNKIPLHFFKGLSLGKLLYKDIAYRHSNDIDILICKEHLAKANELLNSLGFYNHEYDALNEELKDIYFNTYKDVSFINEGGTLIELHIRLAEFALSNVNDYCAQLMQRDGVFQKSLSIPEFNYLCWHGTHSLYHRLKWLVDLKLYVEQLGIDVITSTKLNTASVDRITVISLVILHHLYQLPLPNKIKTAFNQDKITQLITAQCIKGLNHPDNKTSIFTILKNELYSGFIYEKHRLKFLSFFRLLKPNLNTFNILRYFPTKLRFMYILLMVRPLIVIVNRGRKKIMKQLKN